MRSRVFRTTDAEASVARLSATDPRLSRLTWGR